MKDKFGVEIINCENGYLVLEGNSLMSPNSYSIERKKWVCANAADLGQLVEDLALGFSGKCNKFPGGPSNEQA